MRLNRHKRYTYYSSYSSSRRQKIRWDRIAIIVVGVVLVLGIVVWFQFSRIQLLWKGYSFSQQNQILSLESKAVDEILSHDQLTHISDWIENSDQYMYYDEYENYLALHKDMEIKTVVATINDMYTNYVPKLEAMSYSQEQIWNVLKIASTTDLQYIIDKKYSYADMEPYMQVDGFVLSDMEDYIKAYNKSHNYHYEVLITTYPFIDSQNKVNKNYTIQNPDNVLALVKPGFNMASSYEPKDLVTPQIPIAPDCNNPKLRKEASDALVSMYNDAKKEGYALVINSAYRSYKNQKTIYDDYFKKYDEITASSLVAKPGSSEHQTGLGVDLTSESVIKGEKLVFGDTPEYQWVLKNAHKYGFVLRYAEGRSDITGIKHEPWHFRYVGKDAAKKIYENNWTLEEYCLNEGVIPQIKEDK